MLIFFWLGGAGVSAGGHVAPHFARYHGIQPLTPATLKQMERRAAAAALEARRRQDEDEALLLLVD
jgi:hypothetical protein